MQLSEWFIIMRICQFPNHKCCSRDTITGVSTITAPLYSGLLTLYLRVAGRSLAEVLFLTS